jgi:Leucine-rich repeat (LRR) protein
VKKVNDGTLLPKGSFYSLEEANKKPDDVIELNLEFQNLKAIPSDILNYKNLQKLRLDNNEIITIPEWFSRLNGLKYLSLFKNQLGTFPTVLVKMKNLKTIDLAFNHIRSFQQLTYNTSIEDLDLNQNSVGEIPDDINLLAGLKKFIIR